MYDDIGTGAAWGLDSGGGGSVWSQGGGGTGAGLQSGGGASPWSEGGGNTGTGANIQQGGGASSSQDGHAGGSGPGAAWGLDTPLIGPGGTPKDLGIPTTDPMPISGPGGTPKDLGIPTTDPMIPVSHPAPDDSGAPWRANPLPDLPVRVDADSVKSGLSNPSVAGKGGSVSVDSGGTGMAEGSVNVNSDGTIVGAQGSGTIRGGGVAEASGSTDIGGGAKLSGQAKVDADLKTSGGIGSYKDADGHQTYGIDGSVSRGNASAKVALDNAGNASGTVGVDTQAPNASFGASVQTGPGMNLAHIGAEANVGSIGVTERDNNEDSSEKEEIHAGLSAGAGADARLHYGTDPDGHTRYGVGLDAGPVSLDVTTEDPVRTALGVMAAPFTGGMSVTGSKNPLNPLNYIDTDANGKQSNMTTDAINSATNLWHHFAD